MHRVVGFLSFDLMCVHVVTIVLGYAGASWLQVPATTWDLVTTYGGVLLSVAGTVCLVMVVVTSVKKARKRLRYESWHLLHLYAYLGVGLALPHQLWTGQEFLQSTGRTLYWWGLWIAAAGTVLVWRVLLPLVRSLRHGLRVTSVVRESSDVVSVYLTGRRLDRLPLRAGQFLNVRFLDGAGWTRSNPFSLSAAPDGRSLRITAKALGDGSSRLARLRPGTRVMFEGPYGRLSSRARTRPRVLLIGAGVGHHPAPRARRGPGRTRRATRCCCSAAPAEPLFVGRARGAGARARACRPSSCPVPVRTPARSSGRPPGRTSSPPCADWVPDVAERDVFLCGPTAWTAGVERLLAAAGVPADRVHTESFGW